MYNTCYEQYFNKEILEILERKEDEVHKDELR